MGTKEFHMSIQRLENEFKKKSESGQGTTYMAFKVLQYQWYLSGRSSGSSGKCENQRGEIPPQPVKIMNLKGEPSQAYSGASKE